MKLKGCKTYIPFTSTVCFEKNLLGPQNLSIYLMSWVSFPTKSRDISLDKGSF